MARVLLTSRQLLKILLKWRKKLGTQTALAGKLGISDSHLSDVLKGRRKPGPIILARLGMERVSVDYYERVREISAKELP